jgi:hypothetical protein
MKKLTIELTDEAHLQLLSLQLDRKMRKEDRTTLIQVAGDVFSEYLEKLCEEKLTGERRT